MIMKLENYFMVVWLVFFLNNFYKMNVIYVYNILIYLKKGNFNCIFCGIYDN